LTAGPRSLSTAAPHTIAPRAYRIRRRRCGAFTLIEAVICTLIVGTILVAAISTLGASRRYYKTSTERETARLLAADLLAEILSKAYIDPTDTSTTFGLNANEQPSIRPSFDDVDDYDRYEESPPKDAAGTPLLGYDRWSRSVEIQYAVPAAPDQAASFETGVKRITVTVKCAGEIIATRTALRTQATTLK
jgi:type II secretory pathway pseudopilin PulG